MTARAWWSDTAQRREREVLASWAAATPDAMAHGVEALARRNRTIHESDCINLNPATNLMNPRAEALLSSGLGVRPSLGHPGEKYETGLEAVEEIEILAAHLARSVFRAEHAELRVPSGAIANLYAFMATCRPGDAIIVPPASIGGHVTHHAAGAAGLYGLRVHPAPVDASAFTIDVRGLDVLAHEVRPKLITVGGSLNLTPHPVHQIREIADDVGAHVLFDAAHLCGVIAGGAWPNPLDDGAHLMTMSTYKSLGGPPGGMIVTNDDALAERLDAIAYPGLTANFDVAKTAALAVTLADWLEHGSRYATTMVANSQALATSLAASGLPMASGADGLTTSHQCAMDAREWGGGDAAARRLRRANLLASGIGLPIEDGMPGLRFGTPEVTRIGMGTEEMIEIAHLVADALRGDPEPVATRASDLRQRFARSGVRFVNP
jgi:glycine hydroxymethyltransferase